MDVVPWIGRRRGVQMSGARSLGRAPEVDLESLFFITHFPSSLRLGGDVTHP
jgi:hypothetical protein